MPWQEVSRMSLRREFVVLAQAPDLNFTQLCQRYRISRKTGYKWLARLVQEGPRGLVDRSRRPRSSPGRTAAPVEAAVVAVRQAHPAWGGRKIARYVQQERLLDPSAVPHPSTITGILRRHGLLQPVGARKPHAWQRFEHAVPNQLWQMDFKGHFALGDGTSRCYPLTILDDHSRFAVGLLACADEQATTVQAHLTTIFRTYGLPEALLVDNGSPWGDTNQPAHHTALTVWLMRLGLRIHHSRPRHPQTQGKDERFHRTLKAEVLQGVLFSDLRACQQAFDEWRLVYNLKRPHQALGLAVPASCYAVSPRSFPESLPPIEYGPEDIVRKVDSKGEISFHNRGFKVGKAFRGQPVARRPTTEDGIGEVYFLHQILGELDLARP